MRFHVYSFEGDYIRTFNIPYLLGNARNALIGNRLYLSSSAVDDNSSIFVTDLNGNLIRHFEKNPSGNSYINYSNRFLFNNKDRNEIITISNRVPFIERYSTEGEFLDSFDLRKIQSLESLWEYYEEQKAQNTRRRYTVLFNDAYLDGKFLYVNCAGWPGRDNFSYLIKLEIDENIKPVSVFKIQGEKNHALFQTIFVNRDKLLATESSAEAIYEFDLSNLQEKN